MKGTEIMSLLIRLHFSKYKVAQRNRNIEVMNFTFRAPSCTQPRSAQPQLILMFFPYSHGNKGRKNYEI